MQAPWREDQGGNVSRYVPHGQGLAQRGLLATSQVPGELSVAVRSCPMSLRLQVPPPQCQQSGPNGAEGSRSLRPTFHRSSPVLSPNKHVYLARHPNTRSKAHPSPDKKSKAGRTRPEPLLSQAAACGGAGLAPAGEGGLPSLAPRPCAAHYRRPGALAASWAHSAGTGTERAVRGCGAEPAVSVVRPRTEWLAGWLRLVGGVGFSWFPGHRQTHPG